MDDDRQKYALILEDNPSNRDFMVRLMTQAGFTILEAANGKEALEKTRDLPDLMLAMVDMELPDVNGVQMTHHLREKFPQCCIIVATMHDEPSLIARVFKRGGNIFIVKPHGFMELYKRLTTNDLSTIRGQQTIIDQYGPRPFVASSRST